MNNYLLINLDYESYLFDSHYHENADQFVKTLREFEYVYFPFAKSNDDLLVHDEFSQQDLEHYQKLGFEIPKLTLKKKRNIHRPIEYWWGKKHNKELEIFLNSKNTSIEIAGKYGWGFDKGGKIESLEELTMHLNAHPEVEEWILKNPFGMSGKGHYLFSKNQKIPEHIIKSRTLLEPLYKRILDIGTTYEIENGEIKNRFQVINFNDHIGQFKGAGTTSDVKFWKYLFDDILKVGYEKVLTQLDQIAQIYLAFNPENNIQIDSFFYLNYKNEICFYPLVEVNCRKTMGLVAHKLSLKHPELFCEWRFSDEYLINQSNDKLVESFQLSPKHTTHISRVSYFKARALALSSDRPDGFFFQHK